MPSDHNKLNAFRLGLANLCFAFAATAPAVPAVAADASIIVPNIPGEGFRIDLTTMLDRRYFTVTRQRYDFSCGSAALATLLHYHYGVRSDEETTFNGMWNHGDKAAIRKAGFSLLDMKLYLNSIGLESAGFRVTLDQVAKTGVPGIALTVTNGYRHFVVIKGVSASGVLIGDPARGLLRVDRPAFEKIWDGLYFVITDDQGNARKSFNRPAQWGAGDLLSFEGIGSRPPEQESIRLASPALLFGQL